MIMNHVRFLGFASKQWSQLLSPLLTVQQLLCKDGSQALEHQQNHGESQPPTCRWSLKSPENWKLINRHGSWEKSIEDLGNFKITLRCQRPRRWPRQSTTIWGLGRSLLDSVRSFRSLICDMLKGLLPWFVREKIGETRDKNLGRSVQFVHNSRRIRTKRRPRTELKKSVTHFSYPYALNTSYENRAFWQLHWRTSLQTAGDSWRQPPPAPWRTWSRTTAGPFQLEGSLSEPKHTAAVKTFNNGWQMNGPPTWPTTPFKPHFRFWHRVHSTLPRIRKQAQSNMNDAFAANAIPPSASGCGDYPVTSIPSIFYGNDFKLFPSLQFWVSSSPPSRFKSLLPPPAMGSLPK